MREEEIEEGDNCPECIIGVMGFKPVENCTCFISPPCSQCVNNSLVCLNCGWSVEDYIFIKYKEMEVN